MTILPTDTHMVAKLVMTMTEEPEAAHGHSHGGQERHGHGELTFELVC